MKVTTITSWVCLIALLCVSSLAFAASNAVNIGSGGITFPDNSVQTKAAVLPSCSSGGVLVNNSGAWLCGTVLPIDKGIATCVGSLCSVSACQPGFDNCDGVVVNGCEASLTTTQNCGACGHVCPANNICSAGACVSSPNSPLSLTVSGTPSAGFINSQRPVTVTANVVQVAGGPVPAGTTVNFAITAGSGSLTPSSATTDASGNASVTLNSTAEGNITVTASAAPASGTTTIAFSNPNKPGSITLGANPSQGVSGGQVPVTLTASVTPADIVNGTLANGTPVSFTILTGSGTLTGGGQTAIATTTNGVASVTLNSSAAGTVTVNATAGTSPLVTSNTVSVPFISQPTLVTVKVATVGTLSSGTLIGGIKAIVSANPSSGLTIAPSPNGSSTDVVASGVASGALLGTNSTNVAAVTLAPISFSGFTTGEFATLTYHVSAGNFPSAGNFSIALDSGPNNLIDTNGVSIPGVGVGILSVTIQ